MSKKRKMRNRRGVLGVLFVDMLLFALLASCQSCPSPQSPKPPPKPSLSLQSPFLEGPLSVTRFVAEETNNPSLNEDIEGMIDQESRRITLEVPHTVLLGRAYHFTMETEPFDSSQVQAEFPGSAEASLEALELPKDQGISPISMTVVRDELGWLGPKKRYDILVKVTPHQELTEEIVLEELVIKRVSEAEGSSGPKSITGSISGQRIVLEVPFSTADDDADDEYCLELKTNFSAYLPSLDLDKPKRIWNLSNLELSITGQRDGGYTQVKTYTIKIEVDPETIPPLEEEIFLEDFSFYKFDNPWLPVDRIKGTIVEKNDNPRETTPRVDVRMADSIFHRAVAKSLKPTILSNFENLRKDDRGFSVSSFDYPPDWRWKTPLFFVTGIKQFKLPDGSYIKRETLTKKYTIFMMGPEN